MDPLEALGVFLVVVAVGLVIAACALVATWLALLAAGALVASGGVLLIYLADQRARKAAASGRVRNAA